MWKELCVLSFIKRLFNVLTYELRKINGRFSPKICDVSKIPCILFQMITNILIHLYRVRTTENIEYIYIQIE